MLALSHQAARPDHERFVAELGPVVGTFSFGRQGCVGGGSLGGCHFFGSIGPSQKSGFCNPKSESQLESFLNFPRRMPSSETFITHIAALRSTIVVCICLFCQAVSLEALRSSLKGEHEFSALPWLCWAPASRTQTAEDQEP